MAAVGAMQLASVQHAAVMGAAAPSACLVAAAVMSSGVAAAAAATAAVAQRAVHAVALEKPSTAACRQRGDSAHNSARSAHAPAAPVPVLCEFLAHKHHHAQRLAKHDCAHGPIARLPADLASLGIDAQLAAVQVTYADHAACTTSWQGHPTLLSNQGSSCTGLRNLHPALTSFSSFTTATATGMRPCVASMTHHAVMCRAEGHQQLHVQPGPPD